MNSTSTDFSQTFLKGIVKSMMDAFAASTKRGIEMIWGIVRDLLVEHWLVVLGFVLLALIMGFAEYVFTGRWKTLGQVLYRVINWGTLLAIVSVFGVGIFTSDWSDIYLALIGVGTYLLVGILLTKIGIRHR